MKKLIAVVAALCVTAAMVVVAEEKAKEVELKGKLGCAHCDYSQAGEHCGVGFKTADNKVYIIKNASKELFDARTKGGEVKVKGTVTEEDGKLFVKASKTEIVK